MRFVNATVAMQKWKERLDRLEELKAENALLNDTLLEMVGQLETAQEKNDELNDTVLSLVEQMGA